jgi:hypothetical protein
MAQDPIPAQWYFQNEHAAWSVNLNNLDSQLIFSVAQDDDKVLLPFSIRIVFIPSFDFIHFSAFTASLRSRLLSLCTLPTSFPSSSRAHPPVTLALLRLTCGQSCATRRKSRNVQDLLMEDFL